MAVVTLVLMARLLLPCFPVQAATGGDDAFYILCTPTGFVDLRDLYPPEDGAAPPATPDGGEAPVPADGGIFQVCSGVCGLSAPLLAADPAHPAQAAAERIQGFRVPDRNDLPSFALRYDLAARAPPAFPG